MDKNLSEYVKSVRAALGLTQEAFSQLINKRRYVVADYETGRTIPPGNVLVKIQSLDPRRSRRKVPKVMKKKEGAMPIFISKKLSYLSQKMSAEFDRADIESAMRTRWVYDAVFCGWYYGSGRQGPA